MKLNPPASSSDLDVARAIARRLHQRSRGQEPAADVDSAEVAVQRPTPPGGHPPTAGLPPEPPSPAAPPLEPAAPEPPPIQPAGPEPADFEPAPFAPPPEPAVSESGPYDVAVPDAGPPPSTAPENEEAPGGLPPVLTDGDGSGPLEVTSPPPAGPEDTGGLDLPPEPWAPAAPSAETPGDGGPGAMAPPDSIDPDEALSNLGSPEPGPGLEGLEPPGGPGLPEDLVGEPPPARDWQEEAPLPAEVESEATPEDLVAAAGPSWEDVADSCLALTRAHGAMLVDPAGQVLTARGSWPEPGPEAIGGRLVSMMEKTLQDAPTRSVSAPLAGQHLTAWRVPASEGYLTVVFMGEAPLGADVRGPVDGEIKQVLAQ